MFVCTHPVAGLHESSVQTLASDVHVVVLGLKQLSAASLHRVLHSAPPAHGSPECPQVPPLHVSVPLQNSPSLHEAVLAVCTQAPLPLQ